MPEHADIKALLMVINRTQLPAATTHRFSTRVIQNLWTGDVDNSVDNTWKEGTTGGQAGKTPARSTRAAAPSTVDTQALCIKKGGGLGKRRSPQNPQPLLLLRSYNSMKAKNK
jgi:hypothetical protein